MQQKTEKNRGHCVSDINFVFFLLGCSEVECPGEEITVSSFKEKFPEVADRVDKAIKELSAFEMITVEDGAGKISLNPDRFYYDFFECVSAHALFDLEESLTAYAWRDPEEMKNVRTGLLLLTVEQIRQWKIFPWITLFFEFEEIKEEKSKAAEKARQVKEAMKCRMDLDDSSLADFLGGEICSYIYYARKLISKKTPLGIIRRKDILSSINWAIQTERLKSLWNL